MATKKKPTHREKYANVDFPRDLLKPLGVIASMTQENRPEVIARVCGPALVAEMKRVTNGKAK